MVLCLNDLEKYAYGETSLKNNMGGTRSEIHSHSRPTTYTQRPKPEQLAIQYIICGSN